MRVLIFVRARWVFSSDSLSLCSRIYVDTRLQHVMPVLSLKKQSFWDRGDFPTVIQNGSQTVILDNPWVNGTKAAPFDQGEGFCCLIWIGTDILWCAAAFYLILDVAVGGTNGWFPDGAGNKPWLDGSNSEWLFFFKC